MADTLREEIARIVDPEAFALADRLLRDEGPGALGPVTVEQIQTALAKADAVLALPIFAEVEALRAAHIARGD